MKEDYLRIRMSKRRMDKLRLYATLKDTTMTHIIEDFIDSLKLPNIDKNLTAPLPVSPTGKSG
jgi:hypothetical protein